MTSSPAIRPSWSIPNLGVAKVGQPRSDEEWAVLRYELTAFVAEGEYATGLERIMRGYLANLDKPSQPAVWVSGFYGSGKSHLVRVLDSLWTDRVLPDQARASGLVQLPEEIRAHFRELETRSRQFGGRFSAAGVLSAGGTSVALSLLSIVFAAAGLPEDYAQARLVLWLREEGIYDAVADHLAKSGRTLDSVLPHLYVSDHLASAILAAKPEFAATPADVRQLIKAQFPSVSSIDERTFLDILEETLRAVTPGGDIPLTLVVLDELQQFIGDDTDRAHEVQQIVESCCSRLRSRVLFVGTGQMALGATADAPEAARSVHGVGRAPGPRPGPGGPLGRSPQAPRPDQGSRGGARPDERRDQPAARRLRDRADRGRP